MVSVKKLANCRKMTQESLKGFRQNCVCMAGWIFFLYICLYNMNCCTEYLNKNYKEQKTTRISGLE